METTKDNLLSWLSSEDREISAAAAGFIAQDLLSSENPHLICRDLTTQKLQDKVLSALGKEICEQGETSWPKFFDLLSGFPLFLVYQHLIWIAYKSENSALEKQCCQFMQKTGKLPQAVEMDCLNHLITYGDAVRFFLPFAVQRLLTCRPDYKEKLWGQNIQTALEFDHSLHNDDIWTIFKFMIYQTSGWDTQSVLFWLSKNISTLPEKHYKELPLLLLMITEKVVLMEEDRNQYACFQHLEKLLSIKVTESFSTEQQVKLFDTLLSKNCHYDILSQLLQAAVQRTFIDLSAARIYLRLFKKIVAHSEYFDIVFINIFKIINIINRSRSIYLKRNLLTEYNNFLFEHFPAAVDKLQPSTVNFILQWAKKQPSKTFAKLMKAFTFQAESLNFLWEFTAEQPRYYPETIGRMQPSDNNEVQIFLNGFFRYPELIPYGEKQIIEIIKSGRLDTKKLAQIKTSAPFMTPVIEESLKNKSATASDTAAKQKEEILKALRKK